MTLTGKEIIYLKEENRAIPFWQLDNAFEMSSQKYSVRGTLGIENLHHIHI